MAEQPRKIPELHLRLATAMLIALAYAPAIFLRYGMFDDYPFLWGSLFGENHGPGSNFMWSTGRVSWAALLPYVFKAAGSVDGLWILRATSIVLIVVQGLILQRMFRGMGMSREVSAMGALAIAVSPAMGVSAGWASAINIPIGNLLAMLTGLGFVRYLDRSRPPGVTALVCVITALLVAMSLTFYQTCAGVFLLTVVMANWPRITTGIRETLPSLLGAAIFAATSVFYAGFYWKVVVPKWGNPEYIDLAQPDSGLWTGLTTLVRESMTHLASWWWFYGMGTGIVATAIGVLLVAIGVFTRLRTRAPGECLRWTLLLIATGAAAGPLVITSYHSYPDRVSTGLTCVIFVWVSLGLEVVRATMTARWGGRPTAVLAAVASLAWVVLANVTLYSGLIRPHLNEHRALENWVERQSPAEMTAKIVYIQPPPTDLRFKEWPRPVRLRHEYSGFASTVAPWAVHPALDLAFRDLHGQALTTADGTAVQVFLTPLQQESLPMLNMAIALVPSDPTEVNDPRWGTLNLLTDGYVYSASMGLFQLIDPQTLYHPVLGVTHILAESPEGQIFLQTGATSWSTQVSTFPFFEHAGQWYFLDTSVDNIVWHGGAKAISVTTGESRPFAGMSSD